MKIYGASRSDESSWTLLVEVEAMVNPSPLTTGLLSDISNLYPLSPIKLLTMKLKAAMPLPGVFLRNYIYCRQASKESVSHFKRILRSLEKRIIGDTSEPTKMEFTKTSL